MTRRPNVILIMADQWRGDCLSVDGHPVVHTPALDALALRGVRFQRAYSATPSCIPARASLYMGLSPRTHGFVGFDSNMPWPSHPTIASAFTEAGYQTQAVGKMHVFPERSQMGFQNVILHSALGILRDARRRGVPEGDVDDYLPWLRQQCGVDCSGHDHGMGSNSNIARPWDKPERVHYTNFVTEQSIEFLRRRDTGKPFFLFMSFNAPHPPYDPPAWAMEQYLDRSMPDPPIGDWFEKVSRHDSPYQDTAQVSRIDRDRLQRARAGYFGHMTHVDAQINRFMGELHARGLMDNTVLCFLSDHGEMLGDHHCFRKSLPYEGSARVPLILAGPRDSGFQPGLASDAVVELRDVMPTLLECAGVPVPQGVEGRSLRSWAQGKPAATWRSHLHGEHPALGQVIQWVTDGHEKYIWFSGDGHEQLFDLDNDPQELHDLAGDANWQDRLRYWRGVLIQELTGREEGYTDGRQLITGRPFHACLSHLRKAAGRNG